VGGGADVDWQFDGEDGATLLYAIRTAYRGAVSYHNSNRITFKTLPRWRDLVAGPVNISITNGTLSPA
jgi:hypothetical protein